mgnify:CR=1 FL=1
MSLLNRISLRMQRDYCRWQYQRVAATIASTPVVQRGQLPFTLLSMVHTRDVLSYLVALKSFVARANPQRIVMVCDPSITTADREFLKVHVPHLELRHADEFVDPAIPRGGCWERLFAIATLSPEDYVIQLDADTVTTADIPEVCEAIMARRGFVLGEETEQSLLTFEQSSRNARGRLGPNPHIQTLSEAALIDTGLPATKLYVRGCAGFTGFPSSTDMRAAMLDFSGRMAAQLGSERWASWGTEQVTSNYLVANANATQVLPFPKYGTPDVRTDDTAFLHFIGSMRFINRTYELTSLAAITALQRK